MFRFLVELVRTKWLLTLVFRWKFASPYELRCLSNHSAVFSLLHSDSSCLIEFRVKHKYIVMVDMFYLTAFPLNIV